MKHNPALQGLRGLAILYVLIFHLNPKLFPYGFVGVDMFFVLSGYLMAQILGRSKIDRATVWKFYQRRFSRIIPLYVAVVLSTYCGCWLFLISSDKDQLLIDLKWAVSLVSNIQPYFEDHGYWDQLAEFRFLTHAWSLGVELQFYLIAPIIFHFLSKPGHSKQKRSIVTIFILIVASLAFQLVSPPEISYGFLPSRIWQFMCGALCAKLNLCSDADFSRSKIQFYERLCDITAFLLTMIIIWTPFEYISSIQTLIRIFGTIASMIMISCSEKSNSLSLCNSWLCSMGDVSYVCYLLHWPLIVAFRYISPNNLLEGPIVYITLFAVIIILSYFAHFTLEKLLVKADFFVGLVFTILCLLIIRCTIPYYLSFSPLSLTNPPMPPSNINLTEVIEWNKREMDKIFFPLPCKEDSITVRWTNYTGENALRCEKNGKGKPNILVLGNSIAYRAFPLLNELLRGRYSQLRLYSMSGCIPLTNMCPDFTKAARIVVDKIRPDILFHIHVSTEDVVVKPVINLATDDTFQEMQKNLDYYSSRSGHVVIDIPYYVARTAIGGVPVAYEMVKRLQQGHSLTDLKATKEMDFNQQKNHRTRMLSLKCKNCEFNPTNEALFAEGDEYYFYNRTSLKAYTRDGGHFTPEGLNLMRPYYKKIIERLIKKF